MKLHGEAEVAAPPFFTSALDGEKWSVSQPRHFTPGKEPLIPIG
jgi:hypothetical protein